jgi:hypothetical protein
MRAAVAKGNFDQLVGHQAAGGIAKADTGQFLVTEARTFGPVNLRRKIGKKEGHEVPEGMR